MIKLKKHPHAKKIQRNYISLVAMHTTPEPLVLLY